MGIFGILHRAADHGVRKLVCGFDLRAPAWIGPAVIFEQGDNLAM